jgi:uncharacterized membrane protein
MTPIHDCNNEEDFYYMGNVPTRIETPPKPIRQPLGTFDNTLPAHQEEVHATTDEARTRSIIIMGIFAAIFTFLSIDIAILREVCDFEKIVGLMLLTGGILIGFILTLDAIARSWLGKSSKEVSFQTITIAGICLAMIAIGLYLVMQVGGTWNCSTSI